MAAEIPGVKPVTLGADKNYYTRDFVRTLRQTNIIPRVAQNTTGPARWHRWPRDPAPGLSDQPAEAQSVEETFGWMKIVGRQNNAAQSGERQELGSVAFADAQARRPRTEAGQTPQISEGPVSVEFAGCR